MRNLVSRARRRLRRRLPAPLVAIAVVAVLLITVLLLGPGSLQLGPARLAIGPDQATAATSAVKGDEDSIVTFGDDVHIKAGESVDSVVTFGGDVGVDGTVRQGVYTFGGQVVVGPEAQVGVGMTDKELALITMGGETTVIPGAEVVGRDFEIRDLEWVGGGDNLLSAPFNAVSGWGVGLVAAAILGLLAAAILPRQLDAVRSQLEQRPLPSFGWGLVGALLIVPLVSIFLLVTIIGILVLIPWLALVVPSVFVLGYLAAAALVGQRLLQALSARREELWLAVLVGVVTLELVTWIPVLGALAFAIINLAGLGAVLLALRGWRRSRKESGKDAPAPLTPPPVVA